MATLCGCTRRSVRETLEAAQQVLDLALDLKQMIEISQVLAAQHGTPIAVAEVQNDVVATIVDDVASVISSLSDDVSQEAVIMSGLARQQASLHAPPLERSPSVGDLEQGEIEGDSRMSA